MKTTKKTKTSKKESKKFDFERSEKIAGLLGIFAPFMPSLSGECIPVFSQEFVLKNLLGLTEEEYNLNQDLLTKESQNILNAIKMQKQLLESLENRNEVPAEVVETRPAKKSRKEKVN